MKFTARSSNLIRALAVRITVCAMLLISFSVDPSWGGTPTPCKTTGASSIQNLLPSTYSYVQNQAGSTSGNFTVFSPQNVQTTGGCNTGMTPIFGNTDNSTIAVTIDIDSITDSTTATEVSAATSTAIRSSFSFNPSAFNLILSGTGTSPVFPSQNVSF